MKFNHKVILIIIAMCFFTVSISTIPAKASSNNIDKRQGDISEILQNLNSQITENDFIELIKERFENGNESEKTYFLTQDAPENTKDLINLRSSEYTVRPYSLTATFQKKNFWGFYYDFITIVVSGETYIYTDGKVHIFSMGVSATLYESGWNLSIDTPNIVNTDGSMSIGISFVYCTKLDAFRSFGCFVTINRGETRPEVDVTEVPY